MSKKCGNCGMEIDDEAKFCTECGSAIKRNNLSIKEMLTKAEKYLNVIGGICIILFLLNVIGVVNIFGNSTINVKAEDIVSDYVRDEVSAEKKYKNEDVVVTGRLLEKEQFHNSQDYALSIYRDIIAGKRYEVLVDIPQNKVNEANKVKIGDFVTVQGECIGIVKQDDPTYISIQIRSEKIN